MSPSNYIGLRSFWEALDIGDVATTKRLLQSVGDEERETAPFVLAEAAMAFSGGDMIQAGESIDRYVGRWPNEPEGIEWAIRIHHVAGQVERAQKIRALRDRAAALARLDLERRFIECGSDALRLVEDVVTDTAISAAVRIRLGEILFGRNLLGPGQSDGIFDAIGERAQNWSAQSRLFWATVLFNFSSRTPEALDRLFELARNDEIDLDSFAALQVVINRVVGFGNMKVFAARYDLLSLLHLRWAARIDAAMDEQDRRRLRRIEAPAEPTRRIAILAPPLVSLFHAPTARTLDLSAALIGDHGYQVRIFAGGPCSLRPRAPVAGDAFHNVQADALSASSIVFEGIKIEIASGFLDDGQYRRPVTVAGDILAFQPDAVISYGDASPVQSLLADRVPILVMPTGSAPPVGPLDRFAGEWSEDALNEQVARGAWPADLIERAVFGATGVKLPPPRSPRRRQDLVPGARLVLGVAGTRLAQEIRGAFATRLAALLVDRPDLHLVLIGGGDRAALIGGELAPVADRVQVLEFSDDLAGLFCGCDVVLNPYRQGGGTGLAMAMSVGCPVVCLESGDGATLLAREDLSPDLDAYFRRLNRLIDDEAFRREVGDRMPAQVERMLGFDRSIQQVVWTVENMAADFRVGAASPAIRYREKDRNGRRTAAQ